MAKGSKILITGEPRGFRDEGYITDTSKPGMCVEIVPAAALINGHPQWRARSQTAGAVGPIAVLLGDVLQGKLEVGAVGASVTSGGSTITGLPGAGDAYVANTPCFIYWPLPGEELNMLVGDVAGTADTFAIGDLYGVNNNGKLIKDSSYNDAPFSCIDSSATGVAATADAIVAFKFLGRCAG